MFGLREAGILGASVAVAGGVAYLIWNYASSFPGQKTPEPRPSGQDGGSPRREEGEGEKKKKEEEEEERREEATTEQSVVVSAAAAPVVAAKAPQSSESRPVETAGTQVLVLGLNGAGKTSLLHCLATGCLEQDMQPTQGFNAVSINREDMHIEFLEIGGKEELRPYWQKYMSRALLLVFVVDSADPQLFPVAKKHLHELLTSDPRLPLMVLANKQDLPGTRSITDLHDALSLSEVGDRRLFLIGTHVKKGEAELSSGVQDARDLITQMVCEGR
ncbi:ADP-ribosylation factor-like protein 9 isoform X1 [Lates japonicus]|uniref:ADP-ribosylation factor-like protein 9 isoform X1 n=1 Tax=Lates japonicus TaxID=270547 RepID=A0AAD3NDT0_LATJO|nr:ADP-ribosylation factor-like protein 9 isoform X1 [Lates japonicus]